MLDEKTLYSVVEKAKKYDELVRLNNNISHFLQCSFCGKNQNNVSKLIAGPGVYICDGCVELCNEILEENPDVTEE